MAQASRALKAAREEIVEVREELELLETERDEARERVKKLEDFESKLSGQAAKLLEERGKLNNTAVMIQGKLAGLELRHELLGIQCDKLNDKLAGERGENIRLLNEIEHLRHMNLCAVLRAEPTTDIDT